MRGGRNLSREGDACMCSETGEGVADGVAELEAWSAAKGGTSSFIVNWRGSVTGAFGEGGPPMGSSSEIVEAMEDAMDARRDDLSLEPPLRFTLFGPRILRSGAYSHTSPRLRHRVQGRSPLH